MATDSALGFTCLLVGLLIVLLSGPAILPPDSQASKLLICCAFAATVVVPTVLGFAAPVSRLGSYEARQNIAYWGSNAAGTWWHGPKANHDFCEENYHYSAFVAEFHNTWSSMPLIFLGSVGIWYTRKYASLEGRFTCAFLSIGLIGIGSILFHGTLLRWAQVLDEAPMMGLLFIFVFCFLENSELRRFGAWMPWGLCAAFLVCVSTYLLLNVYWLFLLGFIGGSVFLILNGARVALYEASKLTGALFLTGCACQGLAALSWVADHHLCSQLVGLRLHVVWHFGSACGTYLFVMAFVSHRAGQIGERAVLVLPSVFSKMFPNSKDGTEIPNGLHVSVSQSGSLQCIRGSVPEFFFPYVGFLGSRHLAKTD